MKRASKAAEYAAKKHYTSYSKKRRNSAFHSWDFRGAELLKQLNTLLRSATILYRKAQKQRFSQLGFCKSF